MPPERLLTTFSSVIVGPIAVLVIVHDALWPSARVTEVDVDEAAPVHTQAEAA